MNEKDDKLNKGSFLYIGDQDKAKWGYPEGYPYKEIGLIVEWDGNTKGLANPSGSRYYKISDAIPAAADFIGGKEIIVILPEGSYPDTEVTISEADITEGENYCRINTFYSYGNIMVVYEPMTINNWEFTETGIYIARADAFVSRLDLSTIYPISPAFLPQANQTTYGAIKKAVHVPHVTEAPTSNDFNKLLSALREAGIMSQAQ